jgi:hypothetical protein
MFSRKTPSLQRNQKMLTNKKRNPQKTFAFFGPWRDDIMNLLRVLCVLALKKIPIE